MNEQETKINDKLLSDYIIAQLEGNEFSISILHTRILNRLSEGLISLNDVTLVQWYFLDHGVDINCQIVLQ
jgi:hypothetical protein